MRGPRARGAALLAAVCLLPGAARAGDAAKGRAKAGECAACHGASGISTAPDAPHLAGQPEDYLVAQLRAYRSGKRAHEAMALVAKGLTDADIANLAAWFSSIPVRADPEKP